MGEPRGREPGHRRGRGQALLGCGARRSGVRLRLAPRRAGKLSGGGEGAMNHMRLQNTRHRIRQPPSPTQTAASTLHRSTPLHDMNPAPTLADPDSPDMGRISAADMCTGPRNTLTSEEEQRCLVSGQRSKEGPVRCRDRSQTTAELPMLSPTTPLSASSGSRRRRSSRGRRLPATVGTHPPP